LNNAMKLVGWVSFSSINQSLEADGTSADFGRFLSAANPAAQPAVTACFNSTAALSGYPVNSPGFIGATPVPFLFAPTTGSTFGPYSPTTCDGTQFQIRRQHDISTEWRLESTGNGPLTWQLGAYYLHIARKVGVSLGGDEGQGILPNLYNAPDTTNPTTLLLADQFGTNVYAAFASLEYKPTPQFTGGLALRYDSESRSANPLVPEVSDPFTGGPINPGQAYGPLSPEHATFDQLEPKVTLSWRPAAVGNANFSKSRRDAFGIVNLRAGIHTGAYTISVFANNLLDKQYLSEVIPAVEFGGSFVSPGSRRLVGVELAAKF